MRMRLKIIFFFIIASFCFLYLGAQEAQAILVPQIYITDIKITKAGSGPGETLEGVISLWNYENYVVGDLVFRYQLLGGEKNGVSSQLINEKISAEVFKLASGEKSDKQFVYTLPANLPEGNFKFRVQLANARGEELSWIDTDVQIKSDSGFLTLNNYWIVKDGKNLSAGAGVYYPPGQAAEVKFDVINSGNSAVTAYPKITTSKMNAGLGGQIVGESEQESAVFGPGTKKTINVKLPELSQPESYLTEIRFYDTSTKNLISNSIFFRWIIEGKNDAQIQFVNLDKESYVKGEKIKIGVGDSPSILEVIHTPGHTKDSICLLGNDFIFTGDTLFKNGYGRTDLAGGSQKELEESLKKLSKLIKPGMIVYPGHDEIFKY